MRKLEFFAVVLILIVLNSAASAQRYQRQQPAPRAYVHPQFRANPGVRMMPSNRFGPGGQPQYANVGRHGRPLVAGRFGWHEYRNRSAVFAVPLGLDPNDPPMEVDQFIDTIDVTAPLEAFPPCAGPCPGPFGAISVSNDGTAGWAFSYPDEQSARQAATNNCVQAATEACYTNAVQGTMWIAGIQCDNGATHWATALVGSNLSWAITNSFRYAYQQFGYSPNDCALVAAVAADGSQEQPIQQDTTDDVAAAELPPDAPAPALGAGGPFVPVPFDKYWDHNGSRMDLIADGATRKFAYRDPRPGLIEEGVAQGTLVFVGKRQGDQYSGTAYLFSKLCGPRSYSVSGPVSSDQRSVTMYGQKPILNSSCEVEGYTSDTLVFSYQGP